MCNCLRICQSFIGSIMLLLVLLHANFALGDEPACPTKGHLNILTMNVLFGIKREPKPPPLEQRLQTMVDSIEALVEDEELFGMPIHIIVFQELTNGLLAPFVGGLDNSVEFLRQKFLAKGLNYDTREATESGLSGAFVTKNATFVLRPCEIDFKLVTFLPVEERFNIGDVLNTGDLVIPITRNILMVRVKVPGHGKVSVYNTHLCSSCSPADRGHQVNAMLDFVDGVERFIRWFTFRRSPVVLGGDFNIDRFRDDSDSGSYGLIVNEGFRDAYAAFQSEELDQLCEDPLIPDEHCTVGDGVTNLSEEDEPARRIDYVFGKYFSGVAESRVIFNTDITDKPISDHAGVVASLELP